ncbi:hypothetical protein KVV02_005685 [Mortierella alpina]|uniref:SCP2 domain-containing protein n=1 Tax=Mortierella alpina TaxID=64518 RepID=A0A9P8A2X3_MORAP|nr:hypothetical protein KVV02_005685 [Mortierella alpina]
MSNKPSAKAIAKLNATTLFPEIRKEILANPSLFAIRGFFIFNITKRRVPMTEWYLLFQGFKAPAQVSQTRPEIPKAKSDEDPVPVAILQIEDSDLLNFMSGGLTVSFGTAGPRGIVSGKIKIAGAIELAEQLEEIFRKAKGPEKTLAFLEQKRGRSAPPQVSSSPPASSLLMLSEHKPVPAAQSKVHDLARRYSAMAKQTTTGEPGLGLPHDNRARSGSFGRTEGTKVSSLLDKYKETTSASSVSKASLGDEVSMVLTMPRSGMETMGGRETVGVPLSSKREQDNEVRTDVEQAIESSLQVSELTSKVHEIDLVEIPLNTTSEVHLSDRDDDHDDRDLDNHEEEYAQSEEEEEEKKEQEQDEEEDTETLA